MKTSTHTPGPFVVNPVESLHTDIGTTSPLMGPRIYNIAGQNVVKAGGEGGGFYFDAICRMNPDNPNIEADTKLFCAAPDLLEALKATQCLDKPYSEGLEVLQSMGWDYSNRFEYPATKFVDDKIKAAIRKAEENK